MSGAYRKSNSRLLVLDRRPRIVVRPRSIPLRLGHCPRWRPAAPGRSPPHCPCSVSNGSLFCRPRLPTHRRRGRRSCRRPSHEAHCHWSLPAWSPPWNPIPERTRSGWAVVNVGWSAHRTGARRLGLRRTCSRRCRSADRACPSLARG